jgi:hypothetical protein
MGLAGLWAALYLGLWRMSRRPAARPAILARHSARLAETVAATGLLALLTIGFFWQILFTPAWMPAGGGDLAPFLYPNYRFAAEHLKQGDIPLWNPHLYSGVPFAADIQSGLFYPLNLLVFLLTPSLTYEWLEYLAVFHFWLAEWPCTCSSEISPPPGPSIPWPLLPGQWLLNSATCSLFTLAT